MANPLQTNRISDTALYAQQLGLGCGTLGDPDEVTPESQAQATLQTAWDRGIRYFDTAPWYGNTQSEHRLGYFLRQQPRDEYVVSTKVGRVYYRPNDPVDHTQNSPWMKRWKGGLPFDLTFDYSASGVMRSYEDSLMRLGLNRVDALVIHDLDPRHQRSEAGAVKALTQLDLNGGYRALRDLKDKGEIKAIGAGVNHTGMLPQFLERYIELDFILLAMPYTLLRQTALEQELQMCIDHNISVVIGAVFASGILATGVTEHAQYAYQPAPDDIRQRVSAIQDVCRQYDVSLPAAALQFPLGHPAVAAVIPGANSPSQVDANIAAFSSDIPSEFWAALRDAELIDPRAPFPA